MLHKLRDRSTKMLLAEEHHAVQALGFDREHESLCEGVADNATENNLDDTAI